MREKQIAVGVSAFNFGLIDGADLVVFRASGKASTNPDSLESALLAEFDRAAAMMDADGLERARAAARFQFVNSLQTTGGFGGRADALAEGFTYYGDPNYVNTVLGLLDGVTVAQLRSLASERFVPSNRITLVYVPAKKPAATGGN